MKSEDELFKPRRLEEREEKINSQRDEDLLKLSEKLIAEGIKDFKIKDNGDRCYEITFTLDDNFKLITSPKTQKRSNWSMYRILNMEHLNEDTIIHPTGIFPNY